MLNNSEDEAYNIGPASPGGSGWRATYAADAVPVRHRRPLLSPMMSDMPPSTALQAEHLAAALDMPTRDVISNALSMLADSNGLRLRQPEVVEAVGGAATATAGQGGTLAGGRGGTPSPPDSAPHESAAAASRPSQRPLLPTTSTGWAGLNVSLLEDTFDRLGGIFRARRARLVCRRWSKIRLPVANAMRASGPEISGVVSADAMLSIEELTWSCPQNAVASAAGLSSLTGMRNLTSLDILGYSAALAADNAQHIASLTLLTSLKLALPAGEPQHGSMSPLSLARMLLQLRRLKILTVHETVFPNGPGGQAAVDGDDDEQPPPVDLPVARPPVVIEALQSSEWTQSASQSRPPVESLEISCVRPLTLGLRALGSFGELASLSLLFSGFEADMQLHDDSCHQLAGQLTSLSIAGPRGVFCNPISESNIITLSYLSRLQRLSLLQLDLEDGWLEDIFRSSFLTGLTSVDLSENSSVSNASAAYLQSLPLLQTLRISNIQSSDWSLNNNSLALLTSCRNLRRLLIPGHRESVTRDGLMYLHEAAAGLTELDLSYMEIGVMELRELQYLSQLRRLTLRGEWTTGMHTRTMFRYLSMICAIAGLEHLDLRDNISLRLEHLPPLGLLARLSSIRLKGTSAWERVGALAGAARRLGRAMLPDKKILISLELWRQARGVLLKDEEYEVDMLAACEWANNRSMSWAVAAKAISQEEVIRRGSLSD